MSHETLWAPWRLGYVQGSVLELPCEPLAWRTHACHSCFLCRAASAPEHAQALGVVDSSPLSLVVLNRFPYSNGHVLVAPVDHLSTLEDLSDEVLLDLQKELVRWCAILKKVLGAEGFNIGLNLGTVSGAGVPGHLHWHIVPRWSGDVNFMPSIAGTRVLPQSLATLWESLTEARCESHPSSKNPSSLWAKG
ncbi:MAG: HIT domain-containing protein [Planctomycetaceae bacterium]|jgi:ATP adenylyltransferase|nr:HIT domain-containing protein [Planctomycetia bacterium]TSA08963.1 MAG: HIT domain-containing protein [Planctomycetaceae bacterium]